MEINETDYMEKRVQDQINWFNRKSRCNKRWFYGLKVSEIILALFIPFLSAYITDGCNVLKIAVGLIGILVAAVTGLITLFKLQENWIQYRTMAEMITQEQYLYLAQAGAYKDPERFRYFVERIESMLTKENSQWASYVKTTEEKGK